MEMISPWLIDDTLKRGGQQSCKQARRLFFLLGSLSGKWNGGLSGIVGEGGAGVLWVVGKLCVFMSAAFFFLSFFFSNQDHWRDNAVCFSFRKEGLGGKGRCLGLAGYYYVYKL